MGVGLAIIFFFAVSSGDLFLDRSESDLLSIVSTALNQLRIFVYPIPENIFRCSGAFKPTLQKSFNMELMLPKYMKRSVVFSNDPESADLFLIDHEWICLRVNDEPPRYSSNRKSYTGEAIAKSHMLPIFESIINNYPYYNRSQGRDHILIFLLDNGPFCGSGHIQPYMEVVHHILTLMKNCIIVGNNGFNGQNRLLIHSDTRVSKPEPHEKISCHRTGQDIVIPQPINTEYVLNPTYAKNRKAVTFFSGSTTNGMDCSPNIRRKLDLFHNHLFSSDPGMESVHLWRTGSPSNSIFALCPAGNACWSARLYHALAHGTIPVILADPIILPFERFINWSSFSVKYITNPNPHEDEISNETYGYVPPTLNQSLITLTPLFNQLRYIASQHNRSDFIKNKQENIKTINPWLTFHSNSSEKRSAYSLLVAELWCKTKKGSHHRACRRTVSTVAYKSYF